MTLLADLAVSFSVGLCLVTGPVALLLWWLP